MHARKYTGLKETSYPDIAVMHQLVTSEGTFGAKVTEADNERSFRRRSCYIPDPSMHHSEAVEYVQYLCRIRSSRFPFCRPRVLESCFSVTGTLALIAFVSKAKDLCVFHCSNMSPAEFRVQEKLFLHEATQMYVRNKASEFEAAEIVMQSVVAGTIQKGASRKISINKSQRRATAKLSKSAGKRIREPELSDLTDSCNDSPPNKKIQLNDVPVRRQGVSPLQRLAQPATVLCNSPQAASLNPKQCSETRSSFSVSSCSAFKGLSKFCSERMKSPLLPPHRYYTSSVHQGVAMTSFNAIPMISDPQLSGSTQHKGFHDLSTTKSLSPHADLLFSFSPFYDFDFAAEL
jgi:hypothetical protein